MTTGDLLRARADEYELVALWHGERAEADAGHASTADACVAIAVVLREVAGALDVEERIAA